MTSHWTTRQERVLRSMWSAHTPADIAEAVGRSVHAVNRKAHWLGLTSKGPAMRKHLPIQLERARRRYLTLLAEARTGGHLHLLTPEEKV